MELELILDPDVPIHSIWFRVGCLSDLFPNLMRHNEDIVSGVCHIPNRIWESSSNEDIVFL